MTIGAELAAVQLTDALKCPRFALEAIGSSTSVEHAEEPPLLLPRQLAGSVRRGRPVQRLPPSSSRRRHLWTPAGLCKAQKALEKGCALMDERLISRGVRGVQ